MNKVDLQVRRMLMAFPTLYRNRFEAMAEILTNSCFEWDAAGCIVEIFPETYKRATPEAMVQEMQKRLDKAVWAAKELNSEALSRLHQVYIADAERDLEYTKFVASHLDLFSSEYCRCDSNVMDLWLYNTDRNGISEYWSVNLKPEVVDEDWRAAIYEWFNRLLPRVNGLFGMIGPKPTDKWQPLPPYEEVFTWAYDTWFLYQSEKDRQVRQSMAEIARQVIAELDAEGE